MEPSIINPGCIELYYKRTTVSLKMLILFYFLVFPTSESLFSNRMVRTNWQNGTFKGRFHVWFWYLRIREVSFGGRLSMEIIDLAKEEEPFSRAA